MATLINCSEPAPLFELLDLHGDIHRLADEHGRILILNFWSAECPWAARCDQELLTYLPVWKDQVDLWTVASNMNESSDLITRVASERGLPLVLQDVQHHVADLYGAQTTPHLYVIDELGILRYQGALDDVTFSNRIPTRSFLRSAVEALLIGQLPEPAETLSYGCAIVREHF